MNAIKNLSLVVAAGTSLWSATAFGYQSSCNMGTDLVYQGYLQQVGGGAVTDVCDFNFSLLDPCLGGGIGLGNVTVPNVPVANGIFVVQIPGSAFPPGAINGTERWLEISIPSCVNGPAPGLLSPPLKLAPEPHALALPGLWTQQTGPSIAPTTPNLIGGYWDNIVDPGVVGAVISGGGTQFTVHRITDDYGTIGGGLANQAGNASVSTLDAQYATVGGGQGNIALGYAATIGGGNANFAAQPLSTVAGGEENRAYGPWSFIGGGQTNVASNTAADQFATVGGGLSNTAGASFSTISGGEFNTASGDRSFVGGGFSNLVSGASAAVGGGDINTASGNLAVVGGGFFNFASGGSAAVGGGEANTANGLRSTIGGGNNNTADGPQSTVAGGQDNQALSTNNAIGGGNNNTSQGVSATIAGGSTNNVVGDSSTIGGGAGNNVNAAAYATIAGGNSNVASAAQASVGGGRVNTASGIDATVAGGHGNNASGLRTTVGGGWGNTASSFVGATVGGGQGNTASGNSATVGGGESNNASGPDATIGGGANHTASGALATVGGGNANTASGDWASVPGGLFNVAAGDYSFAAGRQAQANHDGTFVWADSQPTNFTSSASNQFLIRASGGVGIGTTSPGSRLTIGGGGGSSLEFAGASGAYDIQATHGGGLYVFNTANNFIQFGTNSIARMTITSAGRVGIGTMTPAENLHVIGNILASGTITPSDARYKRNVEPVSDALEAVDRLRPVHFDWRREEFPEQQFSDQRQIGFIAQELREVAPEVVAQGSDGYYSVDYGRLTPLLTQAIRDLRQEKNAEIEALRQVNSDLMSRVAALECAVAGVSSLSNKQGTSPIATAAMPLVALFGLGGLMTLIRSRKGGAR